MPTLYGNPGSYVPIKSSFTKEHNVNNNMTLTHNLHDLMYRSNGGGRDSYIYSNNGGIMSHDSPKNLKSDYLMSGRFLPR